MTRRNRPEEALHRAVAQFLNSALPPDAVWFHVPNGGARSKAEAGVLKAMGVRAGVPDIYILHRGRSYFIELKPKGRYASQAQKDTMRGLRIAGAECALARSVEGVELCLLDWDIPLSARTAA